MTELTATAIATISPTTAISPLVRAEHRIIVSNDSEYRDSRRMRMTRNTRTMPRPSAVTNSPM